MALFCLENDPQCANDSAVAVLGDIFGSKFINAFVTGGFPSATRPDSTDLAPIILGGLASIAGTLAFVVFFCLIFTSLMRSAQDGEAFGKGSAKSIITFRFIFSIILLSPTASGYSICQVILMFFVMWSNGETNKIYNNVVTASSLSQLGMVADPIDPNAGADILNVRGAALAHFAQAYCYNLVNANYYESTFDPAHSTNNPLSAGGQISSIYTPSRNGVGAAVTLDKAVDEDAGNLKIISLLDTKGQITNNGNRALCGGIKIFTPIERGSKYINATNTSENSRNPVLGLGLDEQKDIFRAIAEINYQISLAKKEVILQATADVSNWMYETNIPYNFSAGVSAYAAQLAEVNYAGLDTVITEAVRKGDREYAMLARANELYNLTERLTSALTSKGWTYAGGIKQRIISAQSSVTETTSRDVIEFTRPQPQLLRADDERSAALKASLAIVDANIERILGTASFNNNPSISTTANAIPVQIDEDTSAEEINSKILDDYTSHFSMVRRLIVNYILTGDFNTGSVSPMNGSSRIKASWLDDDRDIIANIQRTGEFIAVTNGILSVNMETLKVASISSMAATGLLDVTYRIAGAVNQLIMDVVSPVVTKAMSYMHVLHTYMAVVIPSMPYFFFITGVVAWYIHILQAMAGLPFWAIMHMIPEKSFVGSQTQGYVTVVSLFLRPMLTLAGLFFGFMLANPVLLFVTDAFFSMQESLLLSNNSYYGSLTQLLTEMFTFFNWMIVYCTLVLQICYMIFGLAGTLPDTVLRWLGSGLNAGGWGESNAQTALTQGANSGVEGSRLGEEINKASAKKKGKGGGDNGGDGGGGGGGAGGGGAGGGGTSQSTTTPVQGGVDDSRAAKDQNTGMSFGAGGQIASGDSTLSSSTASSAQKSYMASGGVLGANGQALDNKGLWQVNQTRDLDSKGGFKRSMLTAYGVGGAIGMVKGATTSGMQNIKEGFGTHGVIGAAASYLAGIGKEAKNTASQTANVVGNKHFADRGGVPITGSETSATTQGGNGGQFVRSYYNLKNAKDQ